ncbi:MAG TPA: BrnA antitoxin family protein [Rhizomicrobium sp.]|nr:BrnA antitoxin family protein [Rhizomicrobium sp.]
MTYKPRRYGQADEEAPKITPEFFSTMRPAADVDPGVITAAKRSRGRPHVAAPKQVVSVRMNADAAAAFKALSTQKRAALVSGLEADTLQLCRQSDRSGRMKTAKKNKAKTNQPAY